MPAMLPACPEATPPKLPSARRRGNSAAHGHTRHGATRSTFKQRQQASHTREAGAEELLERSMRLRETLRLTTSSTSFTRLLHRRLPIRAGGGEEALHMVRICVENERVGVDSCPDKSS
jgi:hypothetical protein